MKKKQELSRIIAELISQAKSLQGIARELSKMTGTFSADDQVSGIHIPDKLKNVLVKPQANIIPFPVQSPEAAATLHPRRRASENEGRFRQAWLPAMPGKPLPGGFTDYRPLLQRDGLILLSWDKRLTEMGERYTAYWVTSAGIPRFYASRYLPPEDFPSARPDHKSYAAEDGIEFYGQQAPVYVMHVAPELMMNNPRHGELRLAHIQLLKEQGSTVDFTYKYLLKAEKKKNRDRSYKKINHHQAG